MANLGPSEFAKKVASDPKFLIDLILVSDVEQDLIAKGYTLPTNYLTYVNAALDKIRGYITDQGHVLEIKAQDVIQPMEVGQSRSGNGAAGTGW